LRPPIAGGAERADTVRLALQALGSETPEIVLVHDAARPFASPALFGAVAAAAAADGAAIAAEPVVDALWREGLEPRVEGRDRFMESTSSS